MEQMESYESKANVLIVDDNKNNIVVMKKVLSELPVTLHCASCGEEALKIMLRNPFAVVYLDVQMPDMDGYEVAKYMAQNSTTANIPIIFVTAIRHDRESVLQGYHSGAVDYISKPIDEQVLIAKTKIFIKLFEQQEKLNSLVSELQNLANNDTLTGVSNRHQFNQMSEKLLAHNKRYNRKFALLLLDLDDFKKINDNFGHAVGDEFLVRVAQRLKNSIRESDHVSRLGGDEFAILLSELDSEKSAGRIATNIIEIVSKPFAIADHVIIASMSIGIATYPNISDSVEGLFKAADVALYRAKDKGKNRVEYFTDLLNKEADRCAKIESSLRHAIKNNEFTLVYLPRFNMKNKRIVGLEALARWQHSEIGEVSPLEFIAAAEETGIMSYLGQHLMTLAFSQFELWQKKYSHELLRFSINLSLYQMLNYQFIEALKQLVKKYKINFNQIEFEINELIFKRDSKELENALIQIQELGIKIAIDDFGTGYSSLLRLKELPINILKIDRSFIKNIESNIDNAAIVQAMIALGNALKMNVVAEGVETEQQINFLVKHGCSQAQGYYYSSPISIEQVEQLLTEQFDNKVDQ